MTRAIARRGSIAAVLALLVMLMGTSAPALALGRRPFPQPGGMTRQLLLVKAVTTRFLDVNEATAEGYVPTPLKGSLCFEDDMGAMGIHYLNPGLAFDGKLNPFEPELLVYFPTDAGLRLVAVEYFIPDTGQPHPSLFGTSMDGPDSSFEPDIPTFYSLHAWLWFANPDGVFAPFNPRLDCPN